MTSLTKDQKPKHFFIADVKTCQVFLWFEQLSSAISRGTIDLQSTCKQLDFHMNRLFELGIEGVNTFQDSTFC